MMRRLLTAVLALTLAMAGVAVLPEPAQAAGKPKLTFVTVKSAFPTEHCGTYTLPHRKPVLRNSTKANAAKVEDTYNSALAAAQRDALDEYNYQIRHVLEAFGELACYEPTLKVTTTGSIYKGRYVSLASTWTGGDHAADGVRTLNLDLKTGKKVKVTTFASEKHKLFSWATCAALIKKVKKATGVEPEEYCPGSDQRRSLEGWTVSTGGIQVYGYSGWSLYKATLPWSTLIKANYTKSTKKATKKVPGVLDACGSTKTTGTVTVQGNLVTLWSSESRRPYYGVKSDGKQTGKTWRVTVSILPYRGEAYYDIRGYVHFKSKDSSKALKHKTYAVCGL